MAAAKKAPAKGKRPPKKGLRGRMPVKRSINLVLIDENKISVSKAVPGIILIVVLAALFSKYLVADRLVAMSRASQAASGVKTTLDQATEALRQYEGVEDAYAHLTYAGMTQEEMERVDRVKVLELVSTILPEGDASKSWSVTGNMLTVEITGSSLESLNELARRIEESPIVDTCVIATARKDEQKSLNLPGESSNSANQTLAGALEARRQAVENGLVDSVLSAMTNAMQPLLSEEVQARFTIYLRQPPEVPEETPEPEDDASPEADGEAPEAVSEAENAVDAQPKKPSRPIRSEAAQTDAEPEASEETDAEAEPTAEAAQEAAQDGTQPEAAPETEEVDAP